MSQVFSRTSQTKPGKICIDSGVILQRSGNRADEVTRRAFEKEINANEPGREHEIWQQEETDTNKRCPLNSTPCPGRRPLQQILILRLRALSASRHAAHAWGRAVCANGGDGDRGGKSAEICFWLVPEEGWRTWCVTVKKRTEDRLLQKKKKMPLYEHRGIRNLAWQILEARASFDNEGKALKCPCQESFAISFDLDKSKFSLCLSICSERQIAIFLQKAFFSFSRLSIDGVLLSSFGRSPKNTLSFIFYLFFPWCTTNEKSWVTPIAIFKAQAVLGVKSLWKKIKSRASYSALLLKLEILNHPDKSPVTKPTV